MGSFILHESRATSHRVLPPAMPGNTLGESSSPVCKHFPEAALPLGEQLESFFPAGSSSPAPTAGRSCSLGPAVTRRRAPSSPNRGVHWRVLPAPSSPLLLLHPRHNTQPCKKRVGGDTASPTGLNSRSCVAPGTGTQSHHAGRRGSSRHGLGRTAAGQKAPRVRSGAPAARKPTRQRQLPWPGLKHHGGCQQSAQAHVPPESGQLPAGWPKAVLPRDGSGQSGQRRRSEE